MIDFRDALSRHAPPPEMALAQARRYTTQQKAALEYRQRQITRTSWAVICLGFIILIAAIYLYLEPSSAAMAAIAAVSMTVGIAEIGAMVAVVAVAMTVGIAKLGAVVAAGSMLGAALGAALGTAAGSMLGAGAAVAAAGALAGTAVGAATAELLFAKYLKDPLNATNAALVNLVELEATEKPDECIQMDEWREQDKTIESYLTALVNLGRKPVIGEYRAAKEWMESKEKRQREAEKQDRARQACARFEAKTNANA